MTSKKGIRGYEEDAKYEDAGRWIILMVKALDATGVGFGGYSVKPRDDELLMVLRGMSDTMAVVAFVYADDLGALMRKALARARKDTLKWRQDKYQSTDDN